MNKPTIGITLGDPAGIGPEIVVKALAQPSVYACCSPLVIGDAGVIERALETCGQLGDIHPVSSVTQGRYTRGTIDVIDLSNIDATRVEMGTVRAHCGAAAFGYIEKAVDLAMAGEVDALSTGPINKQSLQAARIPYIGHTEILGGLTGVDDPLTMFEVRDLRVFFLSRHVSLRQSCDMVTKGRLLDYIERCIAALRGLGIRQGSLAVAGLNPHSGEHGLFGTEEIEHVEPAVREARERGYDVVGPIAADSVFHQALLGTYVAVLSLYHDQGHIATKTLDFERTVSLTLGLPFLRTSVDHGTAFDIAGTGKASAISILESLYVAAKYAPSFQRRSH